MLQQKPQQPSPTIFVTEQDFDALDRLVTCQRSSAAELLRNELDRAIVLADGELASPFIQLGSWVEYLELPAGRTRIVRLVRPEDADIDKGALSVLTPVGTALLGLSPSDTFSLTMENGRELVLVIIHVEGP